MPTEPTPSVPASQERKGFEVDVFMRDESLKWRDMFERIQAIRRLVKGEGAPEIRGKLRQLEVACNARSKGLKRRRTFDSKRKWDWTERRVKELELIVKALMDVIEGRTKSFDQVERECEDRHGRNRTVRAQ